MRKLRLKDGVMDPRLVQPYGRGHTETCSELCRGTAVRWAWG